MNPIELALVKGNVELKALLTEARMTEDAKQAQRRFSNMSLRKKIEFKKKMFDTILRAMYS